VRVGGTDIHFAQGMRAGDWLFFTGHEAIDFETGLAPDVVGPPGLPNHGQPRYRREGDFILRRLAGLLEHAGSDLAHGVRLDQYYPDFRAVDAYHLSRRQHFGAYIPPSTSVLMSELAARGAGINTSLLAVRPGGGRDPTMLSPDGVPVPPTSGFAASVVSGDYVVVAGQMAQDDANRTLDPRATRPSPRAVWGGTEIRLQTEFLITHRLKPALEAAGSSLRNVVKAQIYLGDIADTQHCMEVWNAHFGTSPCAVTVVPTAGFGFTDGIIEINVFGVRDNGAAKKEVIDHRIPAGMAFGPAAVRAGDLVCLSGLVAAGEDAPVPGIGAACGLHWYGAGARRQIDAILDVAAGVCAAAGSSLAEIVRAHHFFTDLAELYPALHAWDRHLPGSPLPFGAVRVPAPMPVPAATIMLDLWAFAPSSRGQGR
jgi:enamine deaminase RidA (YjgF/YER057c/UK114 family)